MTSLRARGLLDAVLLACFVPVRLAVFAFALRAAWRARLTAAWWLAVSILATTVLPLVAVGSPDGSFAETLLAFPWAPPLAASIAGAMGTRAAFRASAVEPAISPRREPLETTAYALLANALLDAGLFVVTALGAFVVGRGEL